MDLLTKKQKMNSWDVLFFSHCIFIYGKGVRQKVSKCSQKQCIRTTLELWPKISITVQSCSDCLFHLEYLCSCLRMLEMLLAIYWFIYSTRRMCWEVCWEGGLSWKFNQAPWLEVKAVDVNDLSACLSQPTHSWLRTCIFKLTCLDN